MSDLFSDAARERIGEIAPLRRRPWARFVVSAVLMFGVLSVALVPAAKGLKQTMDEQRESSQY